MIIYYMTPKYKISLNIEMLEDKYVYTYTFIPENGRIVRKTADFIIMDEIDDSRRTTI